MNETTAPTLSMRGLVTRRTRTVQARETAHIPSDLVVDRWPQMVRAAQPVISR
jgi:hypothetical protein